MSRFAGVLFQENADIERAPNDCVMLNIVLGFLSPTQKFIEMFSKVANTSICFIFLVIYLWFIWSDTLAGFSRFACFK